MDFVIPNISEKPDGNKDGANLFLHESKKASKDYGN